MKLLFNSQPLTPETSDSEPTTNTESLDTTQNESETSTQNEPETHTQYGSETFTQNESETPTQEGEEGETLEDELKTPEKPFSCSICPKRFNYKINLKRHEVMHKLCRQDAEPRDPEVWCEKCKKKFSSKAARIGHEKRKHQVQKAGKIMLSNFLISKFPFLSGIPLNSNLAGQILHDK